MTKNIWLKDLPIRVTGWSQESWSIGAGGPLSKVVNVGASRADISQSWSTEIKKLQLIVIERKRENSSLCLYINKIKKGKQLKNQRYRQKKWKKHWFVALK